MRHLTPAEKQDLTQARAVLDKFARIDPYMTVSMAKAMIFVAQDEDSSTVSIVEKTGLTQSTVSRYLLDLGTIGRARSGSSIRGTRNPGLGYIVGRPDPISARQKCHSLTEKGTRFMLDLLEICGRKMVSETLEPPKQGPAKAPKRAKKSPYDKFFKVGPAKPK